ncbi:MAG TPA: phosphatidylglycerol lysyltransferase domain-containing protein [Vicinamibacteria bacterium]|nr:phosphatidylglycerol lysyltransferase domain-containing protein [Vicinamibacteria bacterium]
MEALLSRYGYLILFPGVMVEGEAFLLAGAFMAHRGVLDLPTVIAVAMAATMVGDQLYYRAARARGRSWLERRRGSRARYARWIDLTERRGVWLLLASRWTFGLRIVIPAACGAVGMRPVVFTVVDFAAVLIWALTLGLAGYYGGAAIERHLHVLQSAGAWILAGVVLSVAVVIGVRRIRRQGRVRELGLSDLHAIVPFVIGLIGVFNIFTALWPRRGAAMASLERWVPLDVPEGHRVLMLFAGLALLQVTRNLARRKEVAWWVATLALGLSIVSHIGVHFELQRTVVAGLLLAYLLVFHRRFSAKSDPATLRWAVVMAPVLGLAIVAYGAVGLGALREHFSWPRGVTLLSEAVRGGILIVPPRVRPLDRYAARFLVSLQVAGWLARLYLLVLLLRPVVLRDRHEAPPDDVERIRREQARRPLSALALRPDKHHLLVAQGRGLVAYAVRNAVAVACGGPLCAREDLPQAIRDYVEHSLRHGWIPSFYGVPGDDLPAYAAAGLKSLRIGEEGLLHVSPAGSPLAESARAIPEESAGAWPYDRDQAPSTVVDEQIVAVSDEWLADREIGELHFTFGSLDLQDLGTRPVFVYGRPERLEAFCTWLPYAGGRGMALDLVRRRRHAPEGCREALLAASLGAFRAQGVEGAGLGIVPVVASAGGGRGRIGRFALAERLGAIYRYDDLFALKDALSPRWEPRHLAYAGEANLPRVVIAVVDVHTTLHERSPLPRLIAAARALRRRASSRRDAG